MIASLRMRGRRMIELMVIVSTFIFFVIVGVYSGQATMNVDLIGPPDNLELRSSPVELVARVTVRGVPQANVTTEFTLNVWKVGQTTTRTETDNEGIARLLVPAMPGNYSWQVKATQKGYPTIVSRSQRFSVKLLLAVESILPSRFILAVSPVDFQAKVTDMNGGPVQSANVTFYVDWMMIGSNLTDQDGIATLSRALDAGRHTWLASASKGGEGGVSETTLFLVGQLASVVNGDSLFDLPGSEVLIHRDRSSP